MKTVFYLSTVLLLLSCTKVGKTVTIRGRAYNPVTGEGIEGALFTLFRSASLSYDGGGKIVRKFYSDADGNYNESYSLLSRTEMRGGMGGDWHYVGWTINGVFKPGGGTVGIKPGKKMNVDLQAVPFSFLKMNINNVNCQGAGDTLMLYRNHQLPDTGKDGLWVRTGCAGFETNDYTRIPMGMYYYRWVVIRNGVQAEFKDSIYLQPGQQHTFTINY